MITPHNDAYVIIQPPGRLDLDGGTVLRQAFSRLAFECHSAWLVDLTQVDFIDSAGLNALVGGLNLAIAHGRCFKLLAPPPSVKLVLEITRLDQVFEILKATEATKFAAFEQANYSRALATAA